MRSSCLTYRTVLITLIYRTEEEITNVYAAATEDVDVAVKAARKALNDPSWSMISSTERGYLLLKLASLVEENAHQLATIEAWDNGKFLHCRRGLSFTIN
jgi:acyl-CoA reductase-like NAD-dependent aldehyde dehydrogenase